MWFCFCLVTQIKRLVYIVFIGIFKVRTSPGRNSVIAVYLQWCYRSSLLFSLQTATIAAKFPHHLFYSDIICPTAISWQKWNICVLEERNISLFFMYKEHVSYKPNTIRVSSMFEHIQLKYYLLQERYFIFCFSGPTCTTSRFCMICFPSMVNSSLLFTHSTGKNVTEKI